MVNSREYNIAYNKANKDRLNEVIECEICGGRSTRKNLSHHRKTEMHKLAYDKVKDWIED